MRICDLKFLGIHLSYWIWAIIGDIIFSLLVDKYWPEYKKKNKFVQFIINLLFILAFQLFNLLIFEYEW